MRFRLKSGVCLGYRVRGAGKVIALLAPIGMDSRFWKPVMDILSADFRVIAIDYRGHGDSDVTAEPYTVNRLADDCAELLWALAEPCVVVGCSLGGATAQAMAVRHPDLLRGAVLANTSGPRIGPRTTLLEDRAKRASAGMSAIVDETIARWFSPGFAAAHPEVVAEVREWLMQAEPLVHSHGWLALHNRSEDHYPLINCPVLCVSGTHDASSGPASMKSLADAIRGAKYLELADAGHVAPIEQPEAFSAAVKAFAGEAFGRKG
jgi:3-oxoadipate enol-lactonase